MKLFISQAQLISMFFCSPLCLKSITSFVKLMQYLLEKSCLYWWNCWQGCTSNGHVLHSDASCYWERSRSRMAKVIMVNNKAPFLSSLKLCPFLEALYSIHRCKNAYRQGSTQHHGCQEETMSSDSYVKFHFSDH